MIVLFSLTTFYNLDPFLQHASLISWSHAAHCHPMRGQDSVSITIQEPDRHCLISAAGPKSSSPRWIFHLWILQNQCSVFTFPGRDHGSAFSFTTAHLFMPVCVCVLMCFFCSLTSSPPHLLFENHIYSFCLPSLCKIFADFC